MHAPGHLGAALLTYAPLGSSLLADGRDRLALVGAAVALLCASLPDLDEFVPGVEHRGPTHTLWFAGITGAVVGALGALLGSRRESPGSRASAVLAGGVGFASVAVHVAVDALTPMGIRPLAPVSARHVTLDVVYSRDRRANGSLFVAGVLASVLALVRGRSSSGAPGRTDERSPGRTSRWSASAPGSSSEDD